MVEGEPWLHSLKSWDFSLRSRLLLTAEGGGESPPNTLPLSQLVLDKLFPSICVCSFPLWLVKPCAPSEIFMEVTEQSQVSPPAAGRHAQVNVQFKGMCVRLPLGPQLLPVHTLSLGRAASVLCSHRTMRRGDLSRE